MAQSRRKTVSIKLSVAGNEHILYGLRQIILLFLLKLNIFHVDSDDKLKTWIQSDSDFNSCLCGLHFPTGDRNTPKA